LAKVIKTLSKLIKESCLGVSLSKFKSNRYSCDGIQTREGPDPTRAYFWPAVNKRPTRVLSDPTRSNFFWPERKKIEKLDIFGGNSNPNHKWLTWPDPTEPQKIDSTWPGSKNFWPGPITIPDPLPLMFLPSW